ncbi:MAG TPA: aminoglycoside phosphotransferase family protein [Micromonosporaceae bacterium]
MSRLVTLVLIDAGGTPRGVLPPFPVELPYWQEVTDVVAGARERFGVEVTVLRLLHADRPAPHGGAVSYLAQTRAVPRRYAAQVDVDLTPHPRRAPYAEAGGPWATLAWAEHALDRAGRGQILAAVQVRTWNLSAIWRLDTASGTIWLKQVPMFFAHEATVLGWVARRPPGAGLAASVPPLIAADDGRMLLAHVPGADLYGAGVEVRHAIARDMHRVQLAAAERVDALVGDGVPDRRTTPLAATLAAVVADYGGGDPRLGALVDGLDERLAAVATAGLPDTLVHGDLHPGNVRGDADRRVLIDWGDSFVGHPGFDILRLTEGVDRDDADGLLEAWAARWRTAVPGSDPRAAVDLLRPVAALRNAAVYAHFLANIEPAERPYHKSDVPAWLAAATTTTTTQPGRSRANSD